MAPGLNRRQTGTVPKSKSKNSGSQSQRLPREPFGQSSFLDWEHMSDLGNKSRSRNRGSTPRCEAEADSIRHELGRSRSSTVTSQNENGEECSEDGLSNRLNLPERKQVVSKLSQIQSYVQQTAALMNTLKSSDSPAARHQYEKLSVMLEELKDSERKLSTLLNKMDCTESRIDSLLMDVEELQGNNVDAGEAELGRRSEESKQKLEILQKRKQDLLKLQEKAKKQLQEAQAEQSRLVARASSLNQELNINKIMDLNVQQLSQRLKAVQHIYNTRNQINDSLTEGRRTNRDEGKRAEQDQAEMSDTETDLQLVADKMQELNAMKAQLGQIQKIMASISGIQNVAEVAPCLGESGEDLVQHVSHNSQNSCCADGERNGEDGNNNAMKLEQAKSKLNHLTHLLEVVQSAQNTAGLSPSYLQLVSNLVSEEAGSSTHSASPAESVKSLQRNCDNISMQNMQAMTRELEEATAAMKDERDRLLASRQELQDIAKRLPLNKSEPESFSPDEDSESEPPCLKPATLDSNSRDVLNGLTETEESPNCDEGSPYVSRPVQSRSRQRGIWNSSLPGSNYTTQERRSKNESLSRGSNQSSRGNSRALGRDQSRWSPSPSVSYCNDRTNPLAETQNQLEISGNLCEMMLSESLQRGIRPNDISLQEMFTQHQMLTKTVAQCSQLLWLQQKQIIELRNAIMLQCGPFPNLQFQHAVSNQPPLNVPALNNPLYSGLSIGLPFSNVGHVPSVPIQQHQNFLHPANQNVKLNAGEIHNVQVPHQEFPDQFLHQGNQTSSMHFSAPEVFGYDRRAGNFNRFNPSGTPNSNQNTYQNVTSGSNNRGPSGANSVVPEDSGALNNQVPPGNRANNYWDNFRSYSRQNLLSNTKSNEDTDISRRSLISSTQERPPRDAPVAHCSQNNHSAAATQQPSLNCGSLESTLNAQPLLPPSQNTRIAHHGQVTRSRSVEPQNQRNPGKNESRHQDNDSRNFNVLGKNDGWGGGRTRNPDSGSEMIRHVRNDVSQGPRNTDNISSEESAQGNNKKRLERTRCRNDGPGNLNNRGYYNTSLWENIYSEVSNFIRANEGRPHFLLQLFRDLQQVTTDNLRQRTLVAIQETAAANNLTERMSNVGGGNLNIIENRNNIRENRSNLNRNQTEDPNRIDELFCHLRENQNTIRQNIGMSSHVSGGNNLENPNISNIRDLGNSRNNLENEGLRDLRTYFEASLCNFGHNSALENPNLSNIRENLTRRPPGVSDFENVHQKNVYLSIHDNVAVEGRRRNQETSGGPDFGAPYRNFELGNDCMANGFHGNCESIRASNSHFELENHFEGGAVGGRGHFQQENRPSTSRFPALDTGDNFPRPRQFLSSGNDSGIDINYNNDERRGFLEGEGVVDSGSVKPKKNDGAGDVEGAAALVLPQWERNPARDASFDSSSLSLSRNDATSPFVPICVNSFFNCRTFQHSDNGDLAEADQSRNDETSAAESDSGFIGVQLPDPGMGFCCDQNVHSSETDFSTQNIPEAERNFPDARKVEDDEGSPTGAAASEAEGSSALFNPASQSEGNIARVGDASDKPRKNEPSEGLYYQLNASTGAENAVAHRKRREETAERECSADAKTTSGKNSTNKFRDCAFAQEKFEGSDEYENRKTDSDSATSAPDGRQRTESGDSWYYGAFQPVLDASAEGQKGDEADGRQRTESGDSWYYGAFRPVLDKSVEEEKRNTSPEAESDWECGSGLDQVPTRLKKRGSSRKSEDSGDSGA